MNAFSHHAAVEPFFIKAIKMENIDSYHFFSKFFTMPNILGGLLIFRLVSAIHMYDDCNVPGKTVIVQGLIG